jgi:hypothetical protein
MRACLLVAIAICCVACGSQTTPAAATSPTPDPAVRRYVAFVQDYWVRLRVAENATADSNEAAVVCLGNASPTAETDVNIIDPLRCKNRAIALLAVLQSFLTDLGATSAPTRFADDDAVLRSRLPAAITAVKNMISAAATGKKQAVRDASLAFVDVMIPAVTNAFDDIDPSVVHN